MRKHSIEYVKNYFLNEGYTPLFDEYLNKDTPLKILCPRGHVCHMTFGNFKNHNKRCLDCSGLKKYTIDYVKNYFISEGYTPLFNKYIRTGVPLKTMCPKGHICYTSFSDFKNSNHRCLTCYRENNKGKNSSSYGRRHTIESKKKMSEVHASIACGKNNPFYGKHHTESTKKKISDFRKGKYTGKDHPNWKGGHSYKNYCPIFFDKEYKESIRERDNHICQNPYCYKKDRRLHIHHIDYDKKNCGPDNLVTVCGSCNSMANKDREWHIAWYQTIMNHKYGYEYK